MHVGLSVGDAGGGGGGGGGREHHIFIGSKMANTASHSHVIDMARNETMHQFL